MRDIDGDAISFNLYYEGKAGSGNYQEEVMLPVTEETPVFRNIVIQDIVCSGAHCAPHQRPAGDAGGSLTVKRSAITSQEGIVCRNGQNLSIQDMVLRTQDNPLLLFTKAEMFKWRMSAEKAFRWTTACWWSPGNGPAKSNARG